MIHKFKAWLFGFNTIWAPVLGYSLITEDVAWWSFLAGIAYIGWALLWFIWFIEEVKKI